jgi:hypothetical protein
MSLSNKRVRFGELFVREFDRATMGEHPKARGGFALQLGHRYRDLPPVAIPNEPQMRGAAHVSPRRRKAFWIKQWRFEKALLNGRLILGGGQKQSVDEQRLFERQRRHQKPLMERFKEQCRRNREDKLERKLEKRDRQALKERNRIRQENRENHCRRVLQTVREQAAREEQRRFRRAIRENERRRLLQVADQRAREERRRVRREIRENERRRLLQAAASSEEIELERSQPEQRDNSPVLVAPASTNHSSSDTDDLNLFLLLALELAVLSALTVVLLVVLFLLDILLGGSSCKSFFAKLSSSDCAQQCRENLSFCNEYCKRNYCEFVCVSVCLCSLVFLCIRDAARC